MPDQIDNAARRRDNLTQRCLRNLATGAAASARRLWTSAGRRPARHGAAATLACLGLLGSSGVASAVLACLGLLGSSGVASASLIGAQVNYRYQFPSTQSVLNNLGPETVTKLTTFNDTTNGLTSFFIGSQLVIENTVPLAFAGASFNGPQFTFANGGLTGATIDAASSPDFKGALSATGSSVQMNFQALAPALGSSTIIDLQSGGSLAGQQVAYNYLLPTTGSVQESLGTAPLGTGTYFVDSVDGITVAIGASTITVINDEAAAFANGAFNGPDLTFSGVNILGAAIDPVSAADFLGSVSTTPDSIAINFSGLNPVQGHVFVLDVSSSVPEPGSVWLLGGAIAGLGLVSRRRVGLRADFGGLASVVWRFRIALPWRRGLA